MATVLENITDEVRAFIEEQHLFFVASAPLSGNGHVNLSPKGMDCLRVLSPSKVAYLDMTGSGNETSAHIAENGRITFMFCAFTGPANIIRLYGTGRAVLPDTPEWDELVGNFVMLPGARQIIVADIHRVMSSCGYAVPFFEFKSERQSLVKYWNNKEEGAVEEYWREKSVVSMDGLQTPIGAAIDTNQEHDAS